MGGLLNLLTGEDPDKYFGSVEGAPDPSKQEYTADHEKPQTYGAQSTGPNALAGATGDAGGVAAQKQSLARFQDEAKGGLNDADKASLYQTQQSQSALNRGHQGAILQGAQQRGQTGAGSTLAAQLSAAQGDQEAGATAGVEAAGQASNRALQANQAAGALGGAINQQAFNQQATVGNAQNQLNQFNAGQANQAGQFNAAAGNQASQFNIGNDIQSKQFAAQLLQQKFENQLQEAAARAGVTISQQQLALQATQMVAQAVGQGIGAAGTTGKAFGGPVGNAAQAPVPGDSPKNDIVPTMLSPGEVVLPRSVVNSPEKIAAFLEKHAGIHFDSAMKHKSSK